MADILATQIVDSGRSNGTQLSFFDTVKKSAKSAIGLFLNGPEVTTAAVLGAGVASGVEKVGSGIKAAGEGVKSTLTSASSGIKWGIAAVVVLVVLFVAAPYVGLLRRN